MIGPLMRRRWPTLAGAGLATVVMTIGDLAAPWPLKLVIDRVLEGPSAGFHLSAADWRFLILVASGAIVIALVQALAGYAASLWLKRAGEAIVHDLRVATYAHLQRLSVPFHDTRHKGDLVQRITADVNAVGQIFAESLGAVTAAVLLLVGMGALTVWLDPVLAAVLFVTVPPLAFVTFRYRRRVQLLARRQRRAEGEIASIATEALGAIRVVKAFGSERHESDRVEARSEARRVIGVDVSRAEARFAGFVDVLGAVAMAAVLIAGAQRVSTGALTTGGLVVFVAYAQKVYRPLRDLARQAAAISRGMARAERVAEILAADAFIADAADAHRGPRARGNLFLEDVAFAYPGERSALAGVTLAVPTGQCVAVVGASGAGKSTLAALVARFHDPQAGRILIDGRDLRSCSGSWLRDQICLLLQDTVLFSGSVADNIAYATHADRDRVEEAARAAGADGFIGALPDGYDTMLGPDGVGLSGGQRQRIGIARVLLRDPPILLLDEPTTGLDAVTEARFVDSLLGLAAGRTTILITHSIDLARRADRVVVLEGGRIVEDGAPAVLATADGAFARLAGGAGQAAGGPVGGAPAIGFGAYAQAVYRPLRDLSRQAAAISRGGGRTSRAGHSVVADAVVGAGGDSPPGPRAQGDAGGPARRTPRPRPLPPADPRLPGLVGLLRPDGLRTLLARLAPDVGLHEITIRTVDYEPLHGAAITAHALANGAWHDVVVRLDAHRDLASAAVSPVAEALGRLAADRAPTSTPIIFDSRTEALVTWLPVDLALPLLAKPPVALAGLVGADLSRDPLVSVASYRAGVRATSMVGDRVVKHYAGAADHAAAARGLHVAAGAGIGAPALIRDLAGYHAIVLERLDGPMVADGRAAAVADGTGRLVAQLHEVPAYGLVSRRPIVLLAVAAVAVQRAAIVAPDVKRRAADLLARLELALPFTPRVVTSHGDLVASQLCLTPNGLALIDFDEMGAAAPAHDLASFAANRVSGRPGDLDEALLVLEAICEGYGSRPPALEWHLAVAILRRIGTAFRNQKKDWPERTARIVDAAERALTMAMVAR